MQKAETRQNNKALEKETLETISKLPIDVKRALLYFMQSLAKNKDLFKAGEQKGSN